MTALWVRFKSIHWTFWGVMSGGWLVASLFNHDLEGLVYLSLGLSCYALHKLEVRR